MMNKVLRFGMGVCLAALPAVGMAAPVVTANVSADSVYYSYVDKLSGMKNIKSMLENMTIDKYIALFIFIGLLILPLLSSRYSVQIFGKYITYTILALGLDILWGSTGLMNLGFAIFFGLGSYIFGISMVQGKNDSRRSRNYRGFGA